jgi:hypothetical protein
LQGVSMFLKKMIERADKANQLSLSTSHAMDKLYEELTHLSSGATFTEKTIKGLVSQTEHHEAGPDLVVRFQGMTLNQVTTIGTKEGKDSSAWKLIDTYLHRMPLMKEYLSNRR